MNALEMVPADLAESIVETFELLEDDAAMEALRAGLDEAARGETVSWEAVKRELDRL